MGVFEYCTYIVSGCYSLAMYFVKPSIAIAVFGTAWMFVKRAWTRTSVEQMCFPKGVFGRVFIIEWFTTREGLRTSHLMKQLDLPKDGNFLDVCAGSGSTFRCLLQRHPDFQGTMQMVDHSPTAIQSMQEELSSDVEGGRLILHNTKAEKLPFADAQFDVLFAINNIHMFEDIGTLFKEWKRCVKSGGQIVVGFDDPASDVTARSYYFQTGILMRKLFYHSIPEIHRALQDNTDEAQGSIEVHQVDPEGLSAEQGAFDPDFRWVVFTVSR